MISLHTLIARLRSGAKTQDPVRDWLMLLTTLLLVLVIIVVWNVWAFDTVAQGGVIGAQDKQQHSPVDRASLDVVRAVFEQRATEHAKYVTGVYRFADPSQ